MGADDLGPWTAPPVADAVELFRPAEFRWWLTGGHTLEAHLGRSWRSHDDTDIGITRTHAPRLLEVMHGWDIHIAAAGVLTPWDGRELDPDRSENNLWCRRTPDAPWALDILIGDGNDHEWIYRRDPSIRRPWTDAVLTTHNGVPYLAPELQLLFKSPNTRPKDHVDAATVIAALEPRQHAWLAARLPDQHEWHEHLPIGPA